MERLLHLVKRASCKQEPSGAPGREGRLRSGFRLRQEQFLAVAGGFDLDGFFFAVQQRLGDKSVGAGEEGGVQDGFVLHRRFLFIQ